MSRLARIAFAFVWVAGVAPLAAQQPALSHCVVGSLEAPEWPDLVADGHHGLVGHGDLLLVGTEAIAPETGGRVAVYRHGAEGWTLEDLIHATPYPDRIGLKIAFDGTTLAASSRDAVRAFRHDGTEWVQEGLWWRGTDDVYGVGGKGLAVDGDRIAIGGGLRAGSEGLVVILERVDGAWQETARIRSGNLESRSRFADALLLVGDVLFVGEPGSHDLVFESASVRIFEHAAGDWIERDALEPAATGLNSHFGEGLAHEPGRLYVGDPGDGERGLDGAGRVVIFEGSGTAWTQVGELRARRPEARAGMGASVAVRGDRLMVGALSRREGRWGETPAMAWYFEREAGAWHQRARIDRPLMKDGAGDRAVQVQLAGESGFVASWHDPETGEETQADRELDLACLRDPDGDGLPTGQDPCPHSPTGPESDLDGDGVGDGCDLCPATSDPLQADLDGDGLGDACDPDEDGDGRPDEDDACPRDPRLDPCAPCLAQEIGPGWSMAVGRFAESVSASGERVAVVAPQDVTGATGTALEIWRRIGGRLELEQRLVPEDLPGEPERFGSRVALDGDRLLVGGWPWGFRALRWDGLRWVDDGRIPGRAPFALDGDRAFVTEVEPGPSVALRVWERRMEGWTQVHEWGLPPSAVAASHGVIAIGIEHEATASAAWGGVVRLYQARGSGYEPIATLEGALDHGEFGRVLALKADLLLVADREGVLAFRRSGDDWLPEGRLEPSLTPGDADESAEAVALSGGLAAVGRSSSWRNLAWRGLDLHRRTEAGWVHLGSEELPEAGIDEAKAVGFLGDEVVAGYPDATQEREGWLGFVRLWRLPCLGDADADGLSDPIDPCPDDPGGGADPDADAVGEPCDNCRLFANRDQADADGDGLGDACEFVWGDVAPAGAPDGDVNVGDVTRALRLAVGLEPLGFDELRRADLSPRMPHPSLPGAFAPTSSDAADVDVGDVIVLMRTAAGLDRFGAPW